MKLPSLATRLEMRERPTQRSPVMFQKWRDLLFLHWEYEVEAIQRTLPAGLQVDTFAGKAYLGAIPFFMQDVHPRFLPNVPGISNFQELNFRTYVYDRQGTPGIWFYSLDANQQLAVKAARMFYHLPYFYATMQADVNQNTNEITYHSQRQGREPELKTSFRYRPVSNVFQPAEPGALEFFLVERYVLFAYSGRSQQLFTGQVWHPPYPLVEVKVSQWDDNLFPLDGFARPGREPDHVLMSSGVDVDIFSLESR